MKNLLIIKILVLVLTILMVITFDTTVYADSSLDSVITRGDDFLKKGSNNNVINEDALIDTSNTIYNILFTIAIILAVAVGMIIGIQFVVGSVDEKAKIKETLVPYVIGVFVVFAAFGIWKIVVEIGEDISPTAQIVNTIIKLG